MATISVKNTGRDSIVGNIFATFQQLPSKNVSPESYLICLKPNWETLTFEGHEVITLGVAADVSEVILNATDLTIGKIIWEEKVSGNRQEPLEFSIDIDQEQLKIVFEPSLRIGTGYLRINFSGKIYSKGNKGIYKVKQTRGPETAIHHLFTNFEPTFARRCFPCWDEPSFKAIFELCLILPKGLVAVSNMPLKATYPHRSNPELHVLEFMRSPPMTASLVSFCVGHFDFGLKTGSGEKDTCRLFTESKMRSRGQIALNLMHEMLTFFSGYFQVPYPLPKLDCIACPDTASVAACNWGLISLRDSVILTEEEEDISSLFIQQLISVVTQQVAFQWLGCQVTMDWYTSMWLHEGLSIFVSNLAMDNKLPRNEIWPHYIRDYTLEGLEMDSNKFSPALESTAGDMSDLLFHRGGHKATSIIRMLYSYVGPEAFRKGLTLYLERHENGNTNSADFFKTMREVSELPVDEVFMPWMRQPGYPLIKVSANQEGNYRVFTLTQERFTDELLPKEKDRPNKEGKGKEKEHFWMVPITFHSAAKGEISKIVMDKKKITSSVLIGKTGWVTINPGHFGFYRVRYNPEIFGQLLSCIRQGTLPVMERLTVLSDLYAMAITGQSSTAELLSVLEAFVDETNYTVWTLLTKILQKLDLLLDSTDFYKKFQSYGQFICTNIAAKATFDRIPQEDESPLANLLQTLILSTMIRMNRKSTVKDAQNIFESYQLDGTIIAPHIRVPVYQAVLLEAEEDTIRLFLKMYRETSSLEEKDQIAKSFGLVKESEKVRLILDFSISEDVKTTHTISIFQTLASSSSKEGRETTWTFFKEHWNLFKQRYMGTDLLNKLVRCVIEHFASEEKASEVQDFFRDHHFQGLERMIVFHCDKIRSQDAWLRRDLNFIQDYLASYP